MTRVMKNNMKQQAENQHEVGDQVFLRRQPCRKTFFEAKGLQMLAPKFYGPYWIIQCIGQVAYKLSLSTHSKIHLVPGKTLGVKFRQLTIFWAFSKK